MKTTPNISKIRLHSLAAILSRPRLKRSGERRSLLTLLLLIALTAAAFFYLAERPRRYAVFAGYSADGSVAPYVLRYLSGLKAVTDGIVYITDSPLSPEAQKQVAPYVIHGEYQRHGEYDWGSYKRGYNWLKAKNLLRHADELIFANDSAYAPLQTFRPMFNQMRSRSELDFWGNTQNQRFNPHLQSYFLVFRRPVIMSKSFAAFLNGVKAQPDHSLYITEYEIKLTPFLQTSVINGTATFRTSRAHPLPAKQRPPLRCAPIPLQHCPLIPPPHCPPIPLPQNRHRQPGLPLRHHPTPILIR